ncbi:MAG TPA: GGDEF domain-containing protein, partial [Geobacteraceae bacterium]|nr:GGDEF domain-containing protein [Geobacteraceae bacterium]
EILAVCLRNAGDYGKARDDSMRDGLTGLYNRRVLEEMLELEQRKREVVPLSLLLIDLDNFKAINDTYGHPAGDAVLRSAAATLADNARRADLVVRYGGEEFAVMLPSTCASIALDVGERLRKSIENKEVEFNGNRIRVTASLGIAHRSGKDPVPVKEIMSQADQALYQAKNTGKNKVCFYSSSPVLVGIKNKSAGILSK